MKSYPISKKELQFLKECNRVGESFVSNGIKLYPIIDIDPETGKSKDITVYIQPKFKEL